jgi:hypothetical protein
MQTMRDSGWRTSHSEALEDYNAVVAELFDGDRWRYPKTDPRSPRYGRPG